MFQGQNSKNLLSKELNLEQLDLVDGGTGDTPQIPCPMCGGLFDAIGPNSLENHIATAHPDQKTWV